MILPAGLGIFEGAESAGKLASRREEFIKGMTLDSPLIARNLVNPRWKGASDDGTTAATGIELPPGPHQNLPPPRVVTRLHDSSLEIS